jgi:hypothetical protein
MVDEQGEYVVESKPFLDDNGNPIVLEEDTKTDATVATATPQPTTEPAPQPATPA